MVGTVRFGSTGLHLPSLCLGTMTFGYQCDEPTSAAILDLAFDNGLCFLDTADNYPLGVGLEAVGRTEEIIGRWLKGKRDDCIVATKGVNPVGSRPWQRGASRQHIIEAAEASLRRLQTDHIDIYQLHRPDPTTPIDETLSAMTDLVRAGKVRYLGCSNFAAYQVARALGRSETLRLESFASVQPRYNLLSRQIEVELLPMCGEEGLAVLSYNPLAGGLLSGKHHIGDPTPGTRFTLGDAGARYQDRYWSEEMLQTVESIRLIADDFDLPLVQLAIAWVMANPTVTAPIVGVSSTTQLQDCPEAAELTLPTECLKQLDEFSAKYRTSEVVR